MQARNVIFPIVGTAAMAIGGVIGGSLFSRSRAGASDHFWAEGSNQAAAQAPGPSFADLAQRLEPAVVNIKTTHKEEGGGPAMFFGPMGQMGQMGPGGGGEGEALGSGFVISPDGYVVTNNHVVDGADTIEVTLFDKRVYPATVVGHDEHFDVALLKLKAAKDLPTVPLGDSNQLRVGDWVLAIGEPFGLGNTVTSGILSAKDRTLQGNFSEFLQTDAPINPGNSGGPLFNLEGEVIGINTAISAQGHGIGFAIPIDAVKPVLASLHDTGKAEHGYLGVLIEGVPMPDDAAPGTREPTGAKVKEITDGSPADKAGLKKGDVISQMNGQNVRDQADLTYLISEQRPGETVHLTVVRDGKTQTLDVKLGDRAKADELAEREQEQRQQEEMRRYHRMQPPGFDEMDPWGMMGMPWGPFGPQMQGPQMQGGQGQYQGGPGWQMWRWQQ